MLAADPAANGASTLTHRRATPKRRIVGRAAEPRSSAVPPRL